MAEHYWAVRPVRMRETHSRIEKAETPIRAYELAYGRGTPYGAFEAKDLGTRVQAVRTDRTRRAAMESEEGWLRLFGPANPTMKALFLHSYLRFRAQREAVGYDLTTDFFKGQLESGVREFFGVGFGEDGVVRDRQNPRALYDWKEDGNG